MLALAVTSSSSSSSGGSSDSSRFTCITTAAAFAFSSISDSSSSSSTCCGCAQLPYVSMPAGLVRERRQAADASATLQLYAQWPAFLWLCFLCVVASACCVCSPQTQPISTSKALHRTRLTTAALLNTGSLWQYTCEEDPAPVLVARVTGRGVDCGLDKDTELQQPQQVSRGREVGS